MRLQFPNNKKEWFAVLKFVAAGLMALSLLLAPLLSVITLLQQQ